MLKNKHFPLIAFIVSSLSLPSVYGEQKIHVTFDRKGSEHSAPHFRMAQDYSRLKNVYFSVKGLDSLRASASGQLSKNDIQSLKKRVGAHDLIIVDLRQEPHAFCNGEPFHWKKETKDQSSYGITSLEKNFLLQVKSHKARMSSQRKGSILKKSSLELTTEPELTKKYNLKSRRFPTSSGLPPSHQIVNEFVTFIDNLDSDTSLHFHCRQGNGRATTFFIMYDMLMNAHQVSYEDFLKRHTALGGADLAGKSKYASHRTFLKKFYNFAKERYYNPQLTWSR